MFSPPVFEPRSLGTSVLPMSYLGVDNAAILNYREGKEFNFESNLFNAIMNCSLYPRIRKSQTPPSLLHDVIYASPKVQQGFTSLVLILS